MIDCKESSISARINPVNVRCYSYSHGLLLSIFKASGEVLFVDDLPKHPNEAYAAFVLSDVVSSNLKPFGFIFVEISVSLLKNLLEY